MTRQKGFTLIELMIVIAIIAIIAAIAIPNLLAARLNAHETAAISTLRNIATAQSTLQATGRIDLDGDGTGEYGFFRELSAAYGLRADPTGAALNTPLDPPALSGSFRVISAQGTVNRSGYMFKAYLPGDGGDAVDELPSGAFAAPVNADNAEVIWGVYAWPVSHDNSGSRTFFINQSNNMTYADSPVYSGLGFITANQPGAAMAPGGAATSITGLIAIGTVGRDGNVWRQVN